MGFGPIPRMHIHWNFVKLLQGCHSVQKHHNDTTTLNSLHSPAQHVWSETFKILKYAHSECLSQNPVSVFVEAILDFLGGQKKLNLVDFFFVQVSFTLKFLYLLLSLLLMRGKLQLSFVAPKHIRLGLYSSFGEHVVEVSYLVKTSIANNNKKGAVVLFHTVFNQDPDAFVNFLFHFISNGVLKYK